MSDHFGIEYHYYIEFTHLSWDNQYREFVGIISKYPVEQEGYFQLIAGVFPRKVVWNYIDTPFGKINFFNTHLSYNSQSVRIQQSQQVLEYMQNINNQNEASGTILSGDFNDTPATQTITQITETGGDTTYFDSFKKGNPNSQGYTVPSNAPNARIDYIFYSNVSDFHINSSNVVMETPFSGNLYCSDHLGVLSVLKEGPAGNGNRYDQINDKLQISPNPCSGYINLQFQIVDGGFVTIDLFDISGIKVKELLNEPQKPGKYDMEFDISNLPAGVYVIKLQTKNRINMHKIMKR